MKEKILEALKLKFKGGNAQILDRIATELSKTVTDEEGVKTAVEGVTDSYINIITAYGDARATAAQQTAVKTYEDKYGLKDGKKIEGGSGSGGGGGNKNEPEDPNTKLLKQLVEQNKQLTERLDKMDGDRVTRSRQDELNSILSALPENVRKPYLRTPLTGTDEEWNTLKSELQAEVNDLSQQFRTKGALFTPPQRQGQQQASAGSKVEATKEEVAEVAKMLHL